MKQSFALIMWFAVFMSVLFRLAICQRRGWYLRPGNTVCGTYNQTGSCPQWHKAYYPYVNDTLKLLLEHKTWLLAAASSNAKDAPPPSKTCVTITVTDTGKNSECIFNTFNHTPHMAKRVRIVGFDEKDEMEVNSVGAIHRWPLNDFSRTDYVRYSLSHEFLHFNSVIKSATCWNPQTMKFDPYRFVITNPYYGTYGINRRHKAQYLLLIGVNARSPTPEYHLGLLASRKRDTEDIKVAIHFIEYWKKDNRYYYNGGVDYLPPLHVRCATDYWPSG